MKSNLIIKLLFLVFLCLNPLTTYGQDLVPSPAPIKISQIKKVEFIGSEIHPPQLLWQDLIGLTINDKFLTKTNEINDRINQWYWDNGYITTFARVPVQDLSQGVLTIEIIPGTLEEVKINGLKKLNPDYIKSRIFRASQPILNTQNLIEALQLLQESGLFSSFRSELSEGSTRSKSILTIDVIESSSQALSLEGNTFEAKPIGSNQLILGYRNINFLGLGDRLYLQGNLTSGKQQAYGEYEIPISPADTTIRLRGQYGYSQIITPPIDQFKLTSETTQYGVDIRHPIINTPMEALGLTLIYDNKQNQTRLLGFPFGFDPRYPDGKVPFSIFRLGQDYRLRSANSFFFAGSNFSYGIEPESFFSWQFQSQYAHIITPSLLIGVLKVSGQLSGDNLFPEEKFKIGGAYSVRGYEFQCCQGDNGVALSGELRVKAWESDNWQLNIIPFLDLGTVWNNSGFFDQTLSSYGLQIGLSGENIEVTGYCADPLTNNPELEQNCAVSIQLKVVF